MAWVSPNRASNARGSYATLGQAADRLGATPALRAGGMIGLNVAKDINWSIDSSVPFYTILRAGAT